MIRRPTYAEARAWLLHRKKTLVTVATFAASCVNFGLVTGHNAVIIELGLLAANTVGVHQVENIPPKPKG